MSEGPLCVQNLCIMGIHQTAVVVLNSEMKFLSGFYVFIRKSK